MPAISFLANGEQTVIPETKPPHPIYRIALLAQLVTGLIVIAWPFVLPAIAIWLLTPTVFLAPLPLAVFLFPRYRQQAKRSIGRCWGWAIRSCWYYLIAMAQATQLIRGRQRTPRLKNVEPVGDSFIPEATRITMRLLPTQTDTEKIVDALRKALQHAAAEWEPTPQGDIKATFYRHPLPTLTNAQLDLIGADPEFVYLGENADKTPFGWKPLHEPHLIVTGRTAGGKGVTIRMLIAHTIAANQTCAIINTKLSGEFAWANTKPGVTTFQHVTGALTALRKAEQQRQARQQQILAAGADDYRQIEGLKPHYIIIDEIASLVGKGLVDHKDERKEIASLLASIAAQSRSAGVYLALLTQRADVDSLGDMGGQIRNNVGARIIVGGADPEAFQVLGMRPYAQTLQGAPKGRALHHGLNDYPTPKQAQIAWLPATKAQTINPKTKETNNAKQP